MSVVEIISTLWSNFQVTLFSRDEQSDSIGIFPQKQFPPSLAVTKKKRTETCLKKKQSQE